MKLSRMTAAVMATTMLLPTAVAHAQQESAEPVESVAPAESAPSASATGPLAEAFPEDVGGVAIADSLQIATGVEMTAGDEVMSGVLLAAAESMGFDIDDVTMGAAFTASGLDAESGAMIFALHVPGLDSASVRQLMIDVFTVEADPGLLFEDTTVAGREVLQMSVADTPEAAAYFYAGGDIAWMVAAPLQAELEEAISELP